MIKIDFNKQNEKRITITGKSDSFHANVKDITYITYEGSVSIVHLANERKYSISHSLKYFEENLKNDSFFKVHRNTLINTEYINGTQTTHRERSVNINGINIKASRRRIALLKKFLCGKLPFL